jgi:hypothetical protein
MEIYPRIVNWLVQNFNKITQQTVLILASQISEKHKHTIKVITKLPNSEQSYKGKVQTHNYINRQNQSTTGKL